MKRNFTIIILFFINFITAQHTIKGIVLDDFFKNPLSGVEIYIPELEKVITTDKGGTFNIEDLPNKNIKLVFSSYGYKTQTLNVDKTINALRIILEVDGTTLDGVIISTPFNKLESQNVMNITHQNIKELKIKGGNTLIESIATIPGVSQISTGTSIGKPVIRGLSGNRILVYTQGVRLENQQFGDENGLGINEAGITSVEVIKGPATLLYGSDALGGVLYFNDEKFANTKTTNAEIEGKYLSNTDGYNTSAMVKSSSDRFRIIGRATHNTHKDYKIANGIKVNNTRFKENDYKVGMGYNNEKFSTTLRYNYNYRKLGINEDGLMNIQSNSREPEFPIEQVTNHIISLQNQLFFNKSKITANFGYLTNDRDEFEYSDVASLSMQLKTLNYDVKYFFPTHKGLETFIGIQGMQQTNRNHAEEIIIPDGDIQNYGIFTIANYEWKRGVIQAGVRFDNHKTYAKSVAINNVYNSFNASLGYRTKILKNTIFRLNVATGYRAPNLAELASDGIQEGTYRYVKGNINLTNEQNIQTDITFTYIDENIEFLINGFYNDISQYIYLLPTDELINDSPIYTYKQDDANLFGGEFSISYHPKSLDWLHLKSSYETIIAKQKNGNYLPFIPASNVNTTIKTVFNRDNLKDIYFFVNYINVFKQNKISLFETVSNSYNLINLGLGETIQFDEMSLDLNININNLLDTEYISHLSRLKINNIPNAGRNITLGILLKI